MAHTMFLALASCLLLMFITAHHAEGIGICWGRLTSHKLLPSAVVDMLLSDGIPKVKLYSYNYGVLAAFSKSNISITLSLAHKEFYQINTTIGAQKWVNENITSMIKDQVKITHVLIGHEPYTIINNETYYLEDLLLSLQNVQTALNAANLDVKASMAHFTDILKPNITKPSDGDFRDDRKEEILRFLHYLDSQNSPFMLNMYPMFNLYEKGYPLEFGFFEENKNFSIVDGGNVYTNVFDVTYDTIVSALRKNGFPNMQIIVSQVGWPTDGDKYANIQNAKRFYDGFLKKMVNNKGTPLQQGPLEVYIYSLVDENNRTMQVRGPTERHYGIYNYNGQAKFEVDFTLQGRNNKKLEPAQGIAFMPERWCVFDPNVTADVSQHQKYIDLACKKADCSCLTYGSSCHGILDFEGNISYAFNMFFQMNNQRVNDDACNFDGLGKIVEKDPSRGNCTFPLQILSTLFIGGYGEMVATLPKSGETLHSPSGMMIILSLLSMFFTLF